MRILLAEDERSLSRALVALLEKNNYSADAVYDGEEALAYLEAREDPAECAAVCARLVNLLELILEGEQPSLKNIL